MYRLFLTATISFLVTFFTSVAIGENRPLIRSLTIDDPNQSLESYDRTLLYSTRGSPFEPQFLQWDLNNLKKHLHNRGYLFPTVRAKKKTVDGHYHLTIAVRPGPRTEVTEVSFSGNQHFSSDGLEKVFLSKWKKEKYPFYHPGRWLDIPRFIPYVKSQLATALNQVVKHYHTRGYFEAKTVVQSLQFGRRRQSVSLHLAVVEGPRYLWGEIRADMPLTDQKIIAKLEGKPFLIEDMKRVMAKVTGRWQNRGYIKAKVGYRLQPNRKGRTVRGHFKLSRGPKMVVGEIRFIGHHTRDEVIRRYLDVKPGDLLTRKAWRKSLARLKGTRFFSEIKLEMKKSKTPDHYDLEIQLEEKADGHIIVQGGYSSRLGLFAGVGFQILNFDITRWPSRGSQWPNAFTGGGQQLVLRGAVGEKAARGMALFREPYFMGHPIEYTQQFYYREWSTVNFREIRYGSLSKFTRQWEHLSLSLGYHLRNIDLDDLSPQVPVDLREFPGGLWTSSVVGDLFVYDRPNYRIKLGATWEVGHHHLGGDLDFTKVMPQLKVRLPLFGGTQLWGKLHGGWGRRWDDSPLPYHVRYFIGGRPTLRGFAYRRVGTHVNDIPLGGSAFWTARLEYHIPILSWLEVVAFGDMGDIADKVDDLSHGFARLAVGGGLRLKLFSIKIPVALDLAFPIWRRDSDKVQYFSFDLGFTF